MKKSKHASLIKSNIAALEARVKAGKPLTAAQMDWIAANVKDDPKPLTATPNHLAASANDLAKKLGVSRQVIAYHTGRTDAPKTLSVNAWLSYLKVCGSLPTTIRLESLDGSLGHNGSEKHAEIFGDGLLAGFSFALDDIGGLLEAALQSAGVQTTEAQLDRAAISVWLLAAYKVHMVGLRHGCETPLMPMDEGSRFPDSILAVAHRINFDLEAALEQMGLE